MSPTPPPPATPSAPTPKPSPASDPTSLPLTAAASLPVSAAPARPPSPHPSSSPAPGRTRHGLALGLAAASVVPAVLGGASAAPASAAPSLTPVSKPDATTADQQPGCGDPESGDFPISTRLRGGPDTYAPGGGYGTWFLDLTNTTTESCRAIHPVLVLTDEDRKLTADQIQLEFAEPSRPDVEYRVSWETTDQDEHIGVFGGDGAEDFAGFTVPAGRTLTVEVRMAFTSDAVPGRITANAAIVQRQHAASGGAGKDDGSWVGESDDYPFTVVEDSYVDSYVDSDSDSDSDVDSDRGSDETADTGETEGTGDTNGTGDTEGTGIIGGTGETPATGDAPATGETPATGDAPAPRDTPRPFAPGRTPAQGDLPELARTGPATLPYQGITVAGFLIAGGALVIRSRRMRRPRSGPGH
ncbi:hypothetical protein [Streptomyces sp. NBC_01618]|uniref:hypothetical protein n=1 Tax=Streptomyces sp. NBC_01618 TaxID=2975900 RepID=UPI00386B3A60|nr:hypothetical protein OH735_13075 [Streptomyces sp. NBC_01618]